MTRTRRQSGIWLVTAVLGAGLLTAVGSAQISRGAKWRDAGRLSAAREGACSAVLSDGRVLVIGGRAGEGPTGSVDTLDAKGQARPGAPMSMPRSDHTCSVLPDGAVLVAGGSDANGAVNAVELYDPAANSWTSGPPLLVARSGHTASVLQDGRVLVAGGETSGAPTAALEIFDPASRRFAPAGVLSSPRAGHAAAVLRDGRVLLAGGSDGSKSLATADVFDPARMAVSDGPRLSVARAGLSATTLLDGNVLFAGGSDGKQDLATAEVFDAAAGAMQPPVPMLAPRKGHIAVSLPDNNTVLLIGGTSSAGVAGTLERYVPWWKKFEPAGALGVRRTAASAAGRRGVLLVAGQEASGFASVAQATTYPTLASDRSDYVPGMTVTLTGDNWTPGETVAMAMHIERTTGPVDLVLRSIADEQGHFVNSDYVVQPEDLNATFYVQATGSTGSTAAILVFADAPVTSGTGTMAVTPAATWINSGVTFTFTFTNNSNSNDFPDGSRIRVTFPAGWPAPNNFNVTNLREGVFGGTVNTCRPDTDTGWNLAFSGQVIGISISCDYQDSFSFDYTVTTPAAAGGFEFTTESRSDSSGTYTVLRAGSPEVTLSQIIPSVWWIVGPPASAVYGTSFGVAAGTNSSGAVSYQTSGGCTNAGGTVTMSSGTTDCIVMAIVAAGGPYHDAVLDARVTAVKAGQATLSVTGVPQAPQPYGAQFTVGFSGGTAGAVTFSASGACSNAGSVVTMTASVGVCSVTVTRAGDGNYNSITSLPSTVDAKKADPGVSVWPAAGAITYPQTLASSILSGGTAAVAGTFAWTNPGTTPNPGSPSHSVTFTPVDTNYEAKSALVPVSVALGDPVIDQWPSASPITYPQKLSSSILSGGSHSVDGSFSWTNPGETPNAGTPSHSVTFDPSDTRYRQKTAPVPVAVAKGTPVVTWNKPAAITFGSPLGAMQLNATANVPGAFAYSPPPGTVLPVGAGQALSATFTATDLNYNQATKPNSIDVVAAPPPPNAAPKLVLTPTLARDTANHRIVATISIANNGTAAAANVRLGSAKLGTAVGSPLPQALGDIPAGAVVQTTVAFPDTVGAKGALSVLSLSGTYTGGTFSAGLRVALP